MRLRPVEDHRRDAAALVALAGVVVFLGAPPILGRMCDAPVAPLALLGPSLLVAPIVIRKPTRSRYVVAGLLWVPLVLLELTAGFVFNVDHCGLELG